MFTGPANTFPRLVGDIGGTNARFAMIDSPQGTIQSVRTLATDAYPSLTAAIHAYFEELNLPPSQHPKWTALGIATPITSDIVSMVNHHWEFSIATLQAHFQFQHLEVINDFAALAYAIPALPAHELEQIGGTAPQPEKPIAILGAGTGLGISLLIHDGKHYTPVLSEGGHASLPANNQYEAQVIEYAREQLGGHVSAERFLSGPGLVLLHQTLAALKSLPPTALTAADISIAGTQRSCTLCIETLDMFCAMLGSVASNLALTLGAHGGVYIGGGIVPKLGQYFTQSGFRTRFEDKGRFTSYLRPIPCYVIHSPNPALLGAAIALDRASTRA